jgi:hypothetical protein
MSEFSEPKFKLYPQIKLPQQTVVGFDYRIIEIKLFEYLDLTVYLLDSRGQIIDNRILKMENDDYKNWSTDDNYVISWIKKQIT